LIYRASIPSSASARRSSVSRRSQRGSFTVELVVLTPVFIVFVLFVAGLGRFETVRAEVTGAARIAAESAATSASGQAAKQEAAVAVSEALTDAGPGCQGLTISTSIAAFLPGGWVTVTVACTVSWSDLLVPGLPGSATTTSAVEAPIDTYQAVR